MVENEGKKEEKKIEFDSAGEALGYISPDQATVLAIQHARENTDFYGPRYARRELVREVISTEEGEDYYRVRLAYRPIHGFTGEPGIELFTIDKAGPVTLREMLREPRPTRRYVFGLVAVGILAAGGAVGGLLATGVMRVNLSEPPAQTVSVPLAPNVSAQLYSPDGNVVVDVPAGTVAGAAQLTYKPLTPADIPVLPPSFRLTSKAFDISADTVLLKPITITVRISENEPVLASPGKDEAPRAAEAMAPVASPSKNGRPQASPRPPEASKFVIQHFRNGTWVTLDTTVDSATTTATAQADRLSIFALTILAPRPTPTPPPTRVISERGIRAVGDALKFDKSRITVSTGTEMFLTFSNPSAFNQHNWVLVPAGQKDAVAHRGTIAGPANGWLQPGDPDVIAHTRLLDPGAAHEIFFTAPAPGTYQFVCTFPGHSATMFGDFVVDPG